MSEPTNELATGAARDAENASERISVPLERTLIVGASVSAAPADRNPVHRFLRASQGSPKAKTIAIGGAPGLLVLKHVNDAAIASASTVFAIDLFFWDSLYGALAFNETMKAVEDFFARLSSHEKPAVIGTIPSLIGSFQTCRDDLNGKIREFCASHGRFHLLDLENIYHEHRSAGILLDDRRYHVSELMPDGLHPSPIGAEFVARKIRELLTVRDQRAVV